MYETVYILFMLICSIICTVFFLFYLGIVRANIWKKIQFYVIYTIRMLHNFCVYRYLELKRHTTFALSLFKIVLIHVKFKNNN